MALPVELESILAGRLGRVSVSEGTTSSSAQLSLEQAGLSPLILTLRFRLRHKWVGVPAVLSMLELLALHSLEGTITPSIFKKCMRAEHSQILSEVLRFSEFLDSSMVEQMRSLDALLHGRSLGWTSIAELGAELMLHRGTVASDYLSAVGRLMLLGRSINVEFGRAPSPPRPQFCTLCWRFRMTTGKYCSIHSPSNVFKYRKAASSDDYWSARRLLPLFNEWQQRLEREDRKLRLRSEWQCAANEEQVIHWVRLRRPSVYAWLTEMAGAVVGVGGIIDLLDQVPEESAGEKKLRGEFHLLLRADLAAVFNMMCKAEAWMRAASERRNRWGGTRKGAGKRPVV